MRRRSGLGDTAHSRHRTSSVRVPTEGDTENADHQNCPAPAMVTTKPAVPPLASASLAIMQSVAVEEAATAGQRRSPRIAKLKAARHNAPDAPALSSFRMRLTEEEEGAAAKSASSSCPTELTDALALVAINPAKLRLRSLCFGSRRTLFTGSIMIFDGALRAQYLGSQRCLLLSEVALSSTENTSWQVSLTSNGRIGVGVAFAGEENESSLRVDSIVSCAQASDRRFRLAYSPSTRILQITCDAGARKEIPLPAIAVPLHAAIEFSSPGSACIIDEDAFTVQC